MKVKVLGKEGSDFAFRERIVLLACRIVPALAISAAVVSRSTSIINGCPLPGSGHKIPLMMIIKC